MVVRCSTADRKSPMKRSSGEHRTLAISNGETGPTRRLAAVVADVEINLRVGCDSFDVRAGPRASVVLVSLLIEPQLPRRVDRAS